MTEVLAQTRNLVRNLESLSERIRERQEAAACGLHRDRSGERPGEQRRGDDPSERGEESGNENGQRGREGEHGQEG